MHRLKYPAIFTLIILLWASITLRVEAIVFIIPVLLLALSKKYCSSLKIQFMLLFICICYTFSPIAFTFINVQGLPKLVGYCDISVPLSNKEEGKKAIQMQRDGKCIVPSCLSSDFHAKQYIIW